MADTLSKIAKPAGATRGKKRLGRPKGSTTKTKPKKRKRGGLTPEGRKRLSIAMKKRWAERKKKSS